MSPPESTVMDMQRISDQVFPWLRLVRMTMLISSLPPRSAQEPTRWSQAAITFPLGAVARAGIL